MLNILLRGLDATLSCLIAAIAAGVCMTYGVVGFVIAIYILWKLGRFVLYQLDEVGCLRN